MIPESNSNMKLDIDSITDNGGMKNGGVAAIFKNLPGRLGDDSKRPVTDERLDPRRRAMHKAMGTGIASPEMEKPASYDECQAFLAKHEKQAKEIFEAMSANMEAFDDVIVEETTVEGVDGNIIEVEIRRPFGVDKPLPCILSIHGGGMALCSSREKVFTYVESCLARMGAIVVNVEFRNSAGELGPHPFPAGLNDCVSVIDWITSNKEKLGYSSFIVTGASGGGNLAIASAMIVKQKELTGIDGVFVMCPFISNEYHDKGKSNLLSLIENDDYVMSFTFLATIASVYTPDPEGATNPLAWPLHATPEDLSGLPPFFISLNELDPLRDEGKAFYIKLVEAGVSATCHIVCGTQHGGDIFGWDSYPEIFYASLRSIISFCKSFERDQ